MLTHRRVSFWGKLRAASEIMLHLWDYASAEWMSEAEECTDPSCQECREADRQALVCQALWYDKYARRHEAILEAIEARVVRLRAEETTLFAEYEAECRKLVSDKRAA